MRHVHSVDVKIQQFYFQRLATCPLKLLYGFTHACQHYISTFNQGLIAPVYLNPLW